MGYLYMGKPHYYSRRTLATKRAGFYIYSCQKMRYKGDYSPSYLSDPVMASYWTGVRNLFLMVSWFIDRKHMNGFPWRPVSRSYRRIDTLVSRKLLTQSQTRSPTRTSTVTRLTATAVTTATMMMLKWKIRKMNSMVRTMRGLMIKKRTKATVS